MDNVQARIEGVVAEFADLDGREKLELLVEYAAGLPPLPADYQAKKAAAEGRISQYVRSGFQRRSDHRLTHYLNGSQRFGSL